MYATEHSVVINMENGLKITSGSTGIVLAVRVIPRAKKDAVDGLMADGTLKVRLAAPPVDGKANQALIRFLAKFLEVPTSKIGIISGETGRNKLVSISGINADTVQAKFSRGTGEF
jgi:uncharacterized protein (TIGR00251 family)